ncbi:MAG: hypothetical protein JXR83_07075 [Deltaproteobacteria bacterium]|nr:hypothetical protein [Deltaproteobacteria bacterium]
MNGCEHCRGIQAEGRPPGMTIVGQTLWEALLRCDRCGCYRWRTHEWRHHADYDVWSRPYSSDIEQLTEFVAEQMKLENKSKDEVVQLILDRVVWP